MEYTRSEVAKIIGVSASTIKNYDTWNLVRPKRDQNNYRVYTEDDLEKLRELMVFRQLGLEVESDIIPLMENGIYDREKILSYQLAKLNEAQKEIEKNIRLTMLIRILGPEVLALNDPERPIRENVRFALDLLGNPVFDDLFDQADTLSGEEKDRLKAVYQAILDQFQDLLKKNIPPDDPRISELIKRLLDETFSLTPPHQQEKLKKNYHILMKQYLEELLDQT
jgi:DNA-binding transcriptional MerR regulator